MQNERIGRSLRVFSNIYAMVFAAVLVAISVTGKFFSINIGLSLRIGYENLPIVLGGIILGPFAGLIVGLCADVCGCIAIGYSINPIIMLGAGSIGMTAGVISLLFKNRFSPISVILSDITGHIIGSLVVKTIGIAIYYGAEKGIWVLFLERLITYIPVIIFEIIIMLLLFSSGHLRKELNKLLK